MVKPQKFQLTARQKYILSDYQQHQHTSAQTIKSSVSTIDSIESIYKALNERDEIKDKALLMLMLRNWLTEVSSFDPVSGHALHTGIIDFLDAVTKLVKNESPENEIKDRIYRIVSHTKESILAIMEHTRDKILREHAMLPIHAAREVDSNSVQWLSRKPGRNLREKLSGKPYIKAVRRRTSVDTTENRLLKAFLLRLEKILIERQSFLLTSAEDICDELLVFIQRWLRTENAVEIGVWENLPPNNTLLQDKNYRKIWDGWLWLQSIDEQITKDSKRMYKDMLSVIYWSTLSLLNDNGRFRIIQQPVEFDYDNFSITAELAVRGYLFPALNSKINGTIKFIKPDKSFGFITSDDGIKLYFNSNNLSQKLDINSLSAGDKVSFIISNNRQGECAGDITLPSKIILISFNLTSNKLKIQVGDDKYLLHIVSKNLIIEKDKGVKKKFKINQTMFKEVPKEIISLILNTPFKYSVSNNNQNAPTQINSSVVDLCSIRPMFTNNTGSQAYLPFRLLQQIWTLNDGTRYTVDCGHTKAIALSEKIETVSMRNLFLHSSTLPDAIKSSASMFFTKKLSEYLKTDKLTYLIPDWANDFDLEGIRKSINFYFNESTPLPKSIAAIFAWQSSDEFKTIKLCKECEVLVIDSFYGGFSVTPVMPKLLEEVKAKLPETKGITWERHPTFLIKNKHIQKNVVNELEKLQCPYPEDVIQLFGLDGLSYEADKLTLEKDNMYYHIPCDISDRLGSTRKSNTSDNATYLKKYLESREEKNIFVLQLSQSVILDPLLKKYKSLGIRNKVLLTEGALTLEGWQKYVDDVDITFWRDHLPKLTTKIVRDGHFKDFYLVKDATVTPKRGRTVNIPVEEFFTLPAGQTHYKFPLQQGEGNKELQFIAYLKSPAFPLKKDTVCKLEMTYTYGEDNPYELKFIPLNLAEAGFKSIKVEWRPASDIKAINLKSLPIPIFPDRKNWSDFQNFPKEDGKGFNDLLDWVKRDLEKVSDILHYGRAFGVIPKWINKGSDNVFCFIDDIFIHKSSLQLKKDQKMPQQGETLSFYKVKDTKGKLSAEDVTIKDEQPNRCFLSKSLRFPVLTIWNNGHSLSESDVPNHFRNAIVEGTQKIISIIKSKNMPNTLKEELFFFLCCLHKDAPEIVSLQLLNAVKDKKLLRKYHKNIAFAIGNAELPYQQKLLKSIINPIDNEGLTRSITMEVLSIAFWRSKTLINKLTKDELVVLSKNLYECLELDFQKIINDGKGYQIATLCKHLELLLALLRSREIEDEEFKMIFYPKNNLTKKYVDLVDKTSEIVFENSIKLNSRISLQIKKQEIFCNTPDLLYALRMYLTGDSEANTIVITGISDEE